MDVEVTYQNTERFTGQDIDDILVTAFEGGSNYWIKSVKVKGDWPEGATFTSDVVSRGGILEIEVPETDYGSEIKIHELDIEMIKRGLIKYLQTWRGASSNPEDWDAEHTDVILQFALFDEIVFG